MSRTVDVHVTHVLRLSVSDDMTDDQIQEAVEQNLAGNFDLEAGEGIDLYPSKTQLSTVEVQ